MSNSLDVLAQNRDALLLAEVAAWLHMFGKFHEEFLKGNHGLDIKIPDDVRNDFPQLTNLLEDSWTGDTWATLDAIVPEFQARGLSIFNLIKNHRNPQASSGFLRLMADAHGRGSGTEKGVLNRFAQGQEKEVYLSTSLGREEKTYIDLVKVRDERQNFYKLLEEKLRFLEGRHAKLGEDGWLNIRQELIQEIERFFQMAVAETRRPLNDVTLFDQTLASVAFFKASLAQNLLMGWREPYTENVTEQYRWRLLRIGLDGLTFWRDSVRISDLLARKELVERVLDSIQVLLEVTFPLGFEIYRDENGSIFIVPDLQSLPEKTSIGDRQTLEEYIQAIAYKIFSGETILSLDSSDRTRNMLSFGKLATKELPHPRPSIQWLRQEWRGEEKGIDICPVCGLRPQGPTRKALNRKACDECERRRANRSKEWLQNRSTTIWIDEVSDIDGRLALLVAQYGITDWLSGGAFNTVLTFDPQSRQLTDTKRGNKTYDFDLSTLITDIQKGLRGNTTQFRKDLLGSLVLDDARGHSNAVRAFYNLRIADTDLDSATALSESERLALSMLRQSPSFARIERTWESTHNFWKEIESSFVSSIGQINVRLKIQGTFVPRSESQDTLTISHSYELELGNTSLSIVQANEGLFVIVDNLHRTALLLGASKAECTDDSSAAEYILMRLEGGVFDVEEPTGYGSPNKVLGKLQITSVSLENTAYTPAISILTEPRTFMALVPADKALQVAEAIKGKYEREMGKVRNRLPLTVGIVFAGRRTPLPAILDAGRRMLRQSLKNESWEVTNVDPPRPRSSWPGEVKLTLQREGQALSVEVSTIMGDGKTEDVWYPYWRLEKGRENPDPRERLFKGIDGKNWTHVSDLQIGDIVSFMPSRLDFEFLDTAARRFEVSYDDNGKRREPVHPARPYYLERLTDLEELWKLLSEGLATSQIHNLVGLIEAKRMEWATDQDNPIFRDIFKEMLCEIIRNAGWKKDYLSEEQFKQLLQSAITGQLADLAELYTSILGKDNNGQGDNK